MMTMEPDASALQLEISTLREQLAHLERSNAEFQRETQTAVATRNSSESTKKSMQNALDAQRKQLGLISNVIMSMLPQNYAPVAGLEISAHCRPCADVGGDFYDVVPLKDGRVALLMADVAGHGAIAAISMATTRTLMRAALSEATAETTPADIIFRVSTWFQVEYSEDKFVTAWLGIWDQQSGVLSYSSAGHPAAVVWSVEDADPKYLPTEPAFPLGIAGVDPERPPVHEVDLAVGDRVFLYTDGWNESASDSGEFLTDETFLQFLANSAGQPVPHAPLLLFTEFERHAANSRIRDDISLMVFDRVR
ncbi:hypothetical protein BH09SUM1_BH09SUM1_30310 [soil metagenome]